MNKNYDLMMCLLVGLENVNEGMKITHVFTWQNIIWDCE